MRHILAIISLVVLGSLGCKHHGGKCDSCQGGQPGDARAVNPIYQGSQQASGFETIGSPKAMPNMPGK